LALSNTILPATFPPAGTDARHYAGISVDNARLLDGFAAGTLIDTNLGARRVERLARGDKVWTVDGGYQPIRWIAARRVTVTEQMADASLWPVRLRAGALGPGLPAHDLYLSQQHHICTGPAPQHLVPALALVDGKDVQIVPPECNVTYVQFLLDGQHLVRANRVESESFRPTAQSLRGLACQARAELARLFPDMAALVALFSHTTRATVQTPAARLDS
jgi:hypothetical protein